MPLLKTISRSLRARDDDSASDPYSDELEGSSPSVLDTGHGNDDGDSMGSSIAESEGLEELGEKEDEGISPEGSDRVDNGGSGDEDVQAQLRRVPFGELVKAHAKVEKSEAPKKKRKRGQEMSEDTEAKLEALRERLKLLRETERGRGGGAKEDSKAPERRKEASSKTQIQSRSQKLSESNSEGSQSDSMSDSDSDENPHSKATKRSKHAPAALPSTKAVSRKRTVVSSDGRASGRSRDPRFMPTTGSKPTRDKVSKDYAFLNDYRQSEMSALKDRLGEAGKGKKSKEPKKKSKGEKLSEEERDKLKRELVRMESQEQARRERERLEDVMKRHKSGEKDKVAQGKKTFFLKKSEQKKLALVDKFEGMKGKQRDRAIDRRRKKIAGRERKAMPAARRGASG